MRAQVVLDALGGRMRTAILAGIETNPDAVNRTSAAIREAGWRPEIRISDYDLYIGAVDEATAAPDNDDLFTSWCERCRCAQRVRARPARGHSET